MYTINKNSFIWRFLSDDFKKEIRLDKGKVSLCRLVYKLLTHAVFCLFVLLLCLFILSVFVYPTGAFIYYYFFDGVIHSKELLTGGIVLNIIVILGFIGEFIQNIWDSYKEKQKYNDTDNDNDDDSEDRRIGIFGLIKQYIKAKKDKFCPVIQFVDDDKDR